MAKCVVSHAARAYAISTPRKITPANVLVLYRVGDVDGKVIADYYQLKRGIPSANLLEVNIEYTPGTTNITEAEGDKLLSAVTSVLTRLDICSIVTCGFWPVGCGGITLTEMLSWPFFCVTNNAHKHITLAPTTSLIFPVRVQANDYADYPEALKQTYWKQTWGFWALWTRELRKLSLRKKNRYATYGVDASYGYFRLEASIFPGDPLGTMVDVVKRIIDDGIAFEQTRSKSVGNILLSGDSGYGISLASYVEITAGGIPHGQLWLEQLTGTTETTTFGPSYVGPANIRYGTDTELVPTPSGFTAGAYNTLFYTSVGNFAYHSNTKPIMQRADWTYQQGGIAGWARSFSATPLPSRSLDVDYSIVTLLSTYAGNNASQNAKNTHRPIYAANVFNVTVPAFYLRYVGAAAVATMKMSGDTNFEFTTDGVIVTKTIASNVGTPRALIATLAATTLPSGWTVGHGEYTDSRCMQSIKQGACVAIGSIVEPYSDAQWHSTNFIDNLWAGMSIGEATEHLELPDPELLTPYYTHMGTAPADYWTWLYLGKTVYGDPLYRPFGHNWKA